MTGQKPDENCIHFWLVNSQGTEGRCKLCGAVQVYPVGRMTAQEYRNMRKKAQKEVSEARQMTVTSHTYPDGQITTQTETLA